ETTLRNASRFVIGLGALCGGFCGPVAQVDAASPTHASATAKGAAKKAHCGNNIVEPGETCDDGNTKDGDLCPSNCRIEPCKPTKTRFEVSVGLAHPVTLAVWGRGALGHYPHGIVRVPV